MIGNSHSPLHNSTKFKILRNVPIHPHILEKQHYLLQAIKSFGSCYGIFYDFSQGFGSPHLTCIFSANRESSYYTTDHVQSRIIEVNAHEINLRPTSLTKRLPTIATSLRPTSTSFYGRGRGRGVTRHNDSTHDRSSQLFRTQQTTPLNLQPTLSNKFYVIINGVGGIATANVYRLNFNNDGVQARVTNVPFSMHKSFTTEIEAWNYFTLYFPHAKSHSDANFMNKNCPVEASNLTNPSRRFQEASGLNFTIPHNTHEFFYFDNLSTSIQEL